VGRRRLANSSLSSISGFRNNPHFLLDRFSGGSTIAPVDGRAIASLS
jgi:hypothetical protein